MRFSLSEDDYLRIPQCNKLCSSNLALRDSDVYISVCVLTHTLEKKEEMKLYVTRNLHEYGCVCMCESNTLTPLSIHIDG